LAVEIFAKYLEKESLCDLQKYFILFFGEISLNLLFLVPNFELVPDHLDRS